MRQNTPAEINPDHYDDYVKNHTKVWNDQLIKRVIYETSQRKLQKGKLLDVGTGTGQTLISIAEISSFLSFELIGMDFFADMVEKAKENIIFHSLSQQIRIEEGDVHALPYASESMDIIIGRSVVHHWQDPALAFKEIFRVLKPNGFVLIHEPAKDPSNEALEIFNKARHDCGVRDMNLEEKYTAEDVRGQLKEAGIEKYCTIYRGQGIAGIGFEVMISK